MPPRYRPRIRPAELTAARLAHIERRLTACPDLRATVLLRELRDDYAYTGSDTSLRRRVVELLRAFLEDDVGADDVHPARDRPRIKIVDASHTKRDRI